jgi:hypothetical protein
MLPVPFRLIFRNRYAALIWSFGICMMAYDYAGGGPATVDAANSADSNAAQVGALLAEEAS